MKPIVAAAAFAALLAFPVMAQQQPCAPLEAVLNQLVQQYGEELAVMAQRDDGIFVQMWTNPDTGSWTLFRTNGEIACMLDAGNVFTVIAPKPNL